MPNTAVFFPAIGDSPIFLLFWFDFQLTRHFVLTGNFRGLGFDRTLFFFRAYRPLERYDAVLRDDLYVVGIGRQGFVLHNRSSNTPSDFPIRPTFLLLVCRRLCLV